MKINLTAAILDLDGKIMEHEGKPMTLGRICVIALQTPIEEDQKNASPERVVSRWKLCMQLHNAPEAELTAEQMTDIRNRIPKVIVTLAAAAQACDMLKG